jgi:hypothetical protein
MFCANLPRRIGVSEVAATGKSDMASRIQLSTVRHHRIG